MGIGGNHAHGGMHRISTCDLAKIEKPPGWLRKTSKGRNINPPLL